MMRVYQGDGIGTVVMTNATGIDVRRLLDAIAASLMRSRQVQPCQRPLPENCAFRNSEDRAISKPQTALQGETRGRPIGSQPRTKMMIVERESPSDAFNAMQRFSGTAFPVRVERG